MDSASGLIEQLGLAAHPEGGWYRETWRGDAGPDGRAQGTAIIFLLRSGLTVCVFGAGQQLQGLVAPHEWQAARPFGEPVHGYSLVSCVVVPGFDFAGFRLAEPGWEPGA